MDLNKQPIQIDFGSTTAVQCEECENEYFDKVLMIRKVSKLITLEAEDRMVPLETYKCAKCGHINKEFKLGI